MRASTSSKCIATSNKGIATRSKDATRGAPGIATSNKKLLGSIGMWQERLICFNRAQDEINEMKEKVAC